MATPYVYKCRLDRVVDGDTLDTDLMLGFGVVLEKQRVRLVGIDTPESRTRDLAEKKLGLQAKELLKELTQDGFVLESQGRGKYGRILGVLWDFDGNSINQKLIDAGLAVEYWGGTKTKVWGDY
jgi:micrococcal nuclease